jgi:hypothetical protein
MVSLNQVREGSIVYVRGDFGQARAQRVTVTEVEADVKNGLPGICYVTELGDDHWAYITQVDRVVTY